MNRYFISDVHVKNDMSNSKILKDFLQLDYKNADEIYLLGDIFDLMIGDYNEYMELFPWFFISVTNLKNKGVKIFYVQGNHDFHIENLLKQSGIEVIEGPYIIKGEDILICHGDEIEIENRPYQVWRSFIRSRFMALVSQELFNFKIVKAIGDYLSKKSRSRNENRYGNPQDNLNVRDKFRKSAEIVSKNYGISTVICGHSHYQDFFESKELNYYNCGYVPYTKSFLKIDSTGKRELIKIS